ncbi:hypothetical protein BKI51_18825 [Alphaproteobacteria bacterium AO1-B]|nr:hypothetical protein BKI51_18825 [Alphaproteobacteria bacterium AO1-B]
MDRLSWSQRQKGKSGKPLGWDEYIPEFSWPEFEVLDWSTWVPEVNLSEKGRQAIQSLWDGAVEKFDQFIEFIKSIPSRVISAFGKIDLSGAITLPSISSIWSGSAAKPSGETTDAYATGGTVRRTGPMLVGERGPELRYGSKGEFIAHNRQLRQMASLAKAGRRLAAGTVAAASMTGAVAAEPAPPLLPQIAARGGSTGGAEQGGQGTYAGSHTVNNNTFHVTINMPSGSSAAEGRKAADEFVRQINKRLSD